MQSPSRVQARHHHLVLPAALMLGLLAACGGERAAPDRGPDAGAEARPGGSAAVAPGGESRLARANAALAAQRLFAPPGDNALELLLDEIEDEPAEPVSGARRLADSVTRAEHTAGLRQTVDDLYRRAMPWIDRAIADGRFDEAERVRRQLLRVRPDATELAVLERRIAEARAPRPEPPPTVAVRAPTPASPVQPPPAASDTPAASPQPAAPVAATPPVSPPADAPLSAPAATPVAAVPTSPAASTPAASIEEELVAIRRTMPRYPNRALRQRTEGWVRVAFVVRPDGSVADSEVVAAEPAGLFDREALEAIQRWRFAPISRAQRSEQLFSFRPE